VFEYWNRLNVRISEYYRINLKQNLRIVNVRRLLVYIIYACAYTFKDRNRILLRVVCVILQTRSSLSVPIVHTTTVDDIKIFKGSKDVRFSEG